MLLRSRCIQLYLNMSLHVSRSAISEHGKLPWSQKQELYTLTVPYLPGYKLQFQHQNLGQNFGV